MLFLTLLDNLTYNKFNTVFTKFFILSTEYVCFRILPYLVGNIGFIFTKEDLSEVRDLVLSNKKRAPAKAGSIAPLDVFVPAGNTGMGPEKTSFFQALAIPTKITKGTIEILSDIHLIKKDYKVCKCIE